MLSINVRIELSPGKFFKQTNLIRRKYQKPVYLYCLTTVAAVASLPQPSTNNKPEKKRLHFELIWCDKKIIKL